jgi:hypothetical protein
VIPAVKSFARRPWLFLTLKRRVDESDVLGCAALAAGLRARCVEAESPKALNRAI